MPKLPQIRIFFGILFTILVVILSLVTFRFGDLLYRDVAGIFSLDDTAGIAKPPSSPLIIETETIPILYPHEHKMGDSVFDLEHHIFVVSDVITTDQDFWATKIELVLENAPWATLHHAQLFRLDQPDPFCPKTYTGREVFAAGIDSFSPRIFPEQYGIFLPRGTPLFLKVMFHNPLPPYGPGEIYRNVSARLVVDVRNSGHTDTMKPLEYYRLYNSSTACPTVVNGQTFIKGFQKPFFSQICQYAVANAMLATRR